MVYTSQAYLFQTFGVWLKLSVYLINCDGKGFLEGQLRD